MSGHEYGCEELRDAAPELALGVLGGAERAEAVLHLHRCARCQAHVAELTEAADALPLLVDEQEPPAGFEGRVLAEIDAGRRRQRVRRIGSVAVAAAAAAILSITVVRVVDAGREDPVASPRPATVAEARMVSDATGAPAGWASVAGGRRVALSVEYGVKSGTYDIQVQPRNGAPVVIGDVTVTDDRGMWTGTSPVEIGPRSDIALVHPDGERVCHGNLEAGA